MKSSHADYRRYERTGVTLPVTVSHSQHVLPLQLRTLNISSGGLGLVREMGLQMRQGDPVTLRFRGMDDQPLAAHVVHVGPHHVGLSLLKHALSDMELDQLINLAPWLQRQKVRAKRALWTQSRRFAVLSVNTLLRPLLLQQIKPKVLFAVYGSERDVRTYYTPTLQKLLPPMIIAGFIRAGRHRGLMVASQHLESELAKSNDKVEDYLLKLRKEFPKVRRIALVGRLPTFVRKAGLDITAPFVDGSMGTRYMIWDVARQMRALPGYQNDIGIIVLGGAGRIGDPVCRDLLREFPRVIAFDPRYTEEQEEVFTRGSILRTSLPRRLGEHRLLIALTHHGDVIGDMAQYFTPGSLIADDTHPCISVEVREKLARYQVSTRKIVLSHEQFSLWPRMPSWNARDIPGCLVEALVLLDEPDETAQDFEYFRAAAHSLGFRGNLIEPPPE